jgi:hypothetical protein
VLGSVNSPRAVTAGGKPIEPRWRWWSYEPERVGWLAPFVLFIGTLAFGISLIDAFISGLSTSPGTPVRDGDVDLGRHLGPGEGGDRRDHEQGRAQLVDRDDPPVQVPPPQAGPEAVADVDEPQAR